jgi:tetratricopeptide (TPR) repeat protein
MIAWNEEELLPVAVKSADGLADEVVVVDTGSTDGTVRIARELGATVVTGADRYHKGESRNKAMEAASGDWVVILDADERIADPKGVGAFLESTDAQAVYIRLAYVDGKGNPTLSYSQMRCWRRGTFTYKYRAHEVPVPTASWGELAHTDFVWEHRPPPDRKWKREYTLKRLLLDVEENPDAARPLYYLGRQHMYLGQWEESIAALKRYIESSGKRDKADAWHCMAKCHGQMGEKEKQIAALFQACAEQPHRRLWWGELASLYHADGKDELAAGLLKCALELPQPEKTYVNHLWYGSHIHDLLARCLWKLRRYEEGHGHAKKAVELAPDNDRIKKNFQFFADVVESKIEAAPLVCKNGHRNVLYLARRDHANVGYRMMQAVNAQDGWQARSVTQSADYFRYPKDIFMPTREEIDELCRWADVIHIFDSWPRNVARYGKPVFVTYNGKYYKDNREFLKREDAKNNIMQLCTTIDLTRYGAKWIPVPMDGMMKANPIGGSFLVVQAPTRRDVKGTEYVEALRALDGVDVDIIEDVPNAECLERKSRGHVCVDQFILGFGVNALEAWKLGMPVIADAKPEIIRLMTGEIGYIPFVRCEPENLRETVIKLKSDTEFYSGAQQRGIQYVNDFHHPGRVAATLTDLYKRTL